MQKLLNDPGHYVDEALAGMIEAHPAIYRLSDQSQRSVIRRRDKPSGHVGVVSGGGFGHLPLFAGYVGEGLLDACAVGDVFAGPSYDHVMAACREAHKGAGVVAVIGNYGGDRMVFEMVAEALSEEGLPTELVVVADDVASGPPTKANERRGVAGMILLFKIAGAAAEAGKPLGDVVAVVERARQHCRSIGVALSPCVLPHSGQPSFELNPGDIEMGMGIHGEQGTWRGALKTADTIADEMLDRLLPELCLSEGDKVAILCNSLGATPLDELYILYRRLAARLDGLGVAVAERLVGPYATSMEMAGASISIMKLDDELAGLLRAPARSAPWSMP